MSAKEKNEIDANDIFASPEENLKIIIDLTNSNSSERNSGSAMKKKNNIQDFKPLASSRKKPKYAKNAHNVEQKKQSKEKRSRNNETSLPCKRKLQTLNWEELKHPIPVRVEYGLLPLLLKDGRHERNMMKDHPYSRVKTIARECKKRGIHLLQALSLRRHHIQHRNKRADKLCLGLGSRDDIFETAMVFEEAVEHYLIQNKVQFLTEKEQRERVPRDSDGYYLGKCPPTPDFMLKRTMLCENMRINWIEAKMFYGASSIPNDGTSAVGRILNTAHKYVEHYGPGAMVFAYGCGEHLVKELRNLHVIVLDASVLNLRAMEKKQRTWCSDSHGRILM